MPPRTPATLRYRGLLLHLNHYDPGWIRRKAREERFDLQTGLEVVGAMAGAGMNLLVIDIEDGWPGSWPGSARPLRHGAVGMLMTRWVKCSRRNAATILEDLSRLGPLYD